MPSTRVPFHAQSMRASLSFTRRQPLCGPVRASARFQAVARPLAARRSVGVIAAAGAYEFASDALSSSSTTTPTSPSRRRARSVAASASSSSPPASPPAAAKKATKPLPPAITLTPNAIARCLELKRSKDMRAEDALYLRVGVRSGGCNGMSYTMDFTEETKDDDHVFEAGTSSGGGTEGGNEGGSKGESVKIVCDPKSLLFLFGLQLDYSDALIGGGFSFQNPNAEGSCGCGKSFNV